MSTFRLNTKIDRKLDIRAIPILLSIFVLLFSACTPIQNTVISTPSSETSSSPSDKQLLSSPISSEAVLESTSASEETASPHTFPSLTDAPTSTPAPTPTPTRPLLPAPKIPEVSSVITVENANQLTRLTSLGEGDLLNMHLSPDETRIIIGTSNGILIVDSLTFEKVDFLPTSMPAEEISFISGGTKITAKDEKFGYVWTWPDLQETWHGKFPTFDLKEPNNTTNIYPSDDLEFAFSEQHYFEWLTYPNYKESYSDAISGLLRTKDNSVLYLTEYNVKSFTSSPNNEYSAIGTSDNKLVLIQYQDGKVLKEIQESGIKSLQFSPDGKTLIGIFDNQLKFWSIPDLVLQSSINTYGVLRLTYSPDNSVFCFSTKDVVYVYRAEDNQLINAYSGNTITFASDSRSVSIDRGNGQISIFSFNEERSNAVLVDSFLGSGIWQYDAGKHTNAGFFSDDNSKLLMDVPLSWKYENKLGVIVYDVIMGNSLFFPFDGTSQKFCKWAIWLPSLETYAMILCDYSDNCHLAVLDFETSTFERYFVKDTYSRTYPALAYSLNGGLIISAQGYNFVYAWDVVNDGYWKLPFDNTNFELIELAHLSISFSPDDSLAFYTDPSSKKYQINTSDFSITSSISSKRNFYPGEGFIGVTDGSIIRILNTKSNTEINNFTVYNSSLDFNSEKKLLATVSNYGVTVWDLTDLYSEKELFTETVAKGYYYNGEVKFSPDGEYLAAQDTQDYTNQKVSIWNSSDGSRIFQLGYGYGNDFAFSADSKMIAVSSYSSFGSSFSIYDLSTGRPLFTTGNYFCKGGFPPKLAFSPDGKYLAVLCSYAYPQIWGIP